MPGKLLGRIVHKHDTQFNWEKATNFIPMKGELIIYDIDANHDYERIKVGDGETLINNLPFIDDAVKTSLDDALKNKIDKNEMVQSDWSQNDETKMDYIKNRPFYKIEGESAPQLILDTTTFTPIGGTGLSHTTSYQSESIPANNIQITDSWDDTMFTVIFDGVTYETYGWTGLSGNFIGNVFLAEDGALPFASEPFCIRCFEYSENNQVTFYTEDDNQHTIAIYGPEINNSALVKIPEEFLPDGLATEEYVDNALDNIDVSGFVAYDNAQTLSDEQKAQARENISAATMIDKGLIIQSSTPGSTKYFKLTIDDDGVMTASEIV